MVAFNRLCRWERLPMSPSKGAEHAPATEQFAEEEDLAVGDAFPNAFARNLTFRMLDCGWDKHELHRQANRFMPETDPIKIRLITSWLKDGASPRSIRETKALKAVADALLCKPSDLFKDDPLSPAEAQPLAGAFRVVIRELAAVFREEAQPATNAVPPSLR